MRVDDLLASSPVLSLKAHSRSARTIQRAAANGRVVPLLPGVFARPDLVHDPRVRLLAVTAWSPEGSVHGRSAVELLSAKPLSMPIQLRAPGGVASCHWVEVTKGRIPPELRRRFHGVNTVTPAYACLEVAASDSGRAAFDFLRERLVTPADLEATLPAFDRTHGNAERRRVATQAIRNPWSFAEALLQDLLINAGITGWVANEPMWIGSVLIYPDIWFPELGLVVEFDGRASHGPAQFEGDRRRQNHMVTAGRLRVVRITWQMLIDQPVLVLQWIKAAIEMS